MKRVDFYLIGEASHEARLDFCCQLIEKQHKQTPIDAIISESINLDTLDQKLWTTISTSFIPHAIGNTQSTQTISLITADQLQPNTNLQRTLYLNDATTPIEAVLNANHIFEVMTHEPTILSASRLRYRAYKKAGFNVILHEL